jgi:predicted site-specific integrase-resolvase
MPLIGYARVSTEDQATDAQVDALKAAGCAEIFREHMSGAEASRPELAKALSLAGFRRLLEKPRPRFHILRSVTLGSYRLRLETLGDQAAPILGPLWFS